MNNRYDYLHKINDLSLHEHFTYDNRNQLKTITKNGVLQCEMLYDGLGSIDLKTDVGDLNCNTAGKPYQLTEIVPNTKINPAYKTDEYITYTDFNKVDTITTDQYLLEIKYGIGNERLSQKLYSKNGQTQTLISEKTYVAGLAEIVELSDGSSKTINYISSPEGLVAVEISQSSGSKEWYWVFTDHLGSITSLVRESDGQKFEMSFDAWGNRRDPATWVNYTTTLPDFIIDRGFTGHEHYDEFGLINMNGRVYDPVIARFLSPDSYIQAPGLAQNYNGYIYCLNNPLKYTDPSGEIFVVDDIIIVAAIGAAIGAASYTASIAFSPGGFDNWQWGQFFKSMGIGAVSGVVTAGIGNAFGAVGSGGLIGEVGRAAVHGYANGMISQFTGGDFMTGLAAGGIGSLAGSGFQSFFPTIANSTAGTIGFSALGGGIGAELTGGNFWEGAAIGASVGLLNHSGNVLKSSRNATLQVRAARAFLTDLGYPEDQVNQDVVKQNDKFFSKYYARLNHFEKYQNSFTGGYYDSYSNSYDAQLSTTRVVTVGTSLSGNKINECYAAKYYPSRSHSIGLVRTGFDHIIEAGLETFDGIVRNITKFDNAIYDMHYINSFRYLKCR